MKKMGLNEIVYTLIDLIYRQYQNTTDEELSEIYYQFLINEYHDPKFLTEEICFHYDFPPELLKWYKKNILLKIVADGYGFLRYIHVTEKITEEEKNMLMDLDNLPFSIENIIHYFKDKKNQKKIHSLIQQFFIFRTQSSKFQQDCEEYLFDEPTEFYDKISHIVKYLAHSYDIADIYREVEEEYSFGEEECDESNYEKYDREDYEGYDIEDSNFMEIESNEKKQIEQFKEKQQELFKRVAIYLETAYSSKIDCDDFIGFFMSYVYAILLELEENQELALEEKEILKIFRQEVVSFEFIVELFYESVEYVYYAVNVFSEIYHHEAGDIYNKREQFKKDYDIQIFQLLDFYYERPEFQIAYFGSPIVKTFDKILRDMKEQYSEEYETKIYQMLREKEGQNIFSKYGLDSKYTPSFQIQMIRYLLRKYLEHVSTRTITTLNVTEIIVYEGLMEADITKENLLKLFDMGYSSCLSGYYYQKSQDATYEKKIVRVFKQQGLLGRIAMIDPGCLGDSIYIKVMQESNLFAFLEENGIKTTITSLEQLQNTHPELVFAYLKEIVVSNYYYAKKAESLDAIQTSIVNFLESPNLSLGEYLQGLIQNKELLAELLNRYLESENKEEYIVSYEDKIENYSKVKQKLYPGTKKET